MVCIRGAGEVAPFGINEKGAASISPKEKADAFYRKVFSIRLLCYIIDLPQATHKKAG